jgi:hypothetical protein
MWYGDPQDARRAARHAARAARHAARHARRAAYYQYGYRYRPGGWFIGPFILAAIFFFALPAIWKGIGFALVAIAVCGLIFWVIRTNARRSYSNYQQPPYYQPHQPPQQQPYTYSEAEPRGYEQGYTASQPQEKQPEDNQQYYYPPQTPYEQPQAQYPEQMPPMQQ